MNRPVGFYVYEHSYNGKRMYIGKGMEQRVLENKSRAEYDWNEWNILMDGLTKEEAFELENFLIEIIGHENLVNQAPLALRNKQRVWTQESKDKITAYWANKKKNGK